MYVRISVYKIFNMFLECKVDLKKSPFNKEHVNIH